LAGVEWAAIVGKRLRRHDTKATVIDEAVKTIKPKPANPGHSYPSIKF
jgi:hypothetical protein